MMCLPPKTAEIDGKFYHIRNSGNWYDIYRIICALNDNELSDSDKWYCAFKIFFPYRDELAEEDLKAIPKNVLFGEDIEDYAGALNYIAWFIDRGETDNDDIPRSDKKPKTGIDISFFQDMDLLVDSLNNAKDRDIRLSYEHWWTFVGDTLSHEPTGMYKMVLEIRHKLKNHSKLDKFDKQFLSEHKNRVLLQKRKDDWLEGED